MTDREAADLAPEDPPTAATLVLLPGMDGTGRLFAPFIDALGGAFETRVVRYPPRAALDYAALEPIARAALPEDRPYVLLGESFSGPIAVSLAASRPPGLRGLVLCCSFVWNPRPVLRGLRALVGALPVARAPLPLVARVLLGGFGTPALRAALGECIAEVSGAAMAARLRAVIDVDVTARVAEVEVPLLVLRAARDRVVPAAASEQAIRGVADARVVTLDGPHLLLQTRPAAAAQVVAEFVRGATCV